MNRLYTFYTIRYNKIVSMYIINQKVGERMVQEMSDKELIAITIDRYAELQRIKQSNGSQENKELDYSIRLAVAKLSSLGVNVEDITL
ncbi:MAG: hypothetical protein NC312_14650 [Bacteroides fragilis]|nr:hypothetical protein [Bacteroides fragilis]